MISDEMQQVVLDLLAEQRKDGIPKFSQRQVARLTGRSRGYVRRMAQRISHYKIGRPPETVRCERCKTMALADEPCGECRLRRLHKQINPVGHPPSDMELELMPAEQRRYEEVRHLREL